MEAGNLGPDFCQALDGRKGAGSFVSIILSITAACGWVKLQTLVVGKFGPVTQPQHSSAP